jgi:hypothetical protein
MGMTGAQRPEQRQQGGKKSAGPPPDYMGAAQWQADSSRRAIQEQTAANRPNVSGPFSSQRWTRGPNGEWQLTTGLAGGLGQGLPGQAAAALQNPLDPSLFGPVQTGDQAREQAISSAYGAATSRLDPMFAQREEAQRAQLANQGLDPTSAAYRAQMGNFGRERTDAYNQALSSAIGQGTAAGHTAFQDNAQAQQMAIANALRQRQQPLAEMQQLQGMANNAPSFMGAGAADPTQYLAAMTGLGNWRLADKQMENQAAASAMQGLMSLFGAAGGGIAKAVSDERAKQNVRRWPIEALPGVPFATWEWRPGFEGSGPTVGVIAQDLARAAPRYVLRGEDGLLRVDYSFLWGGRP